MADQKKEVQKVEQPPQEVPVPVPMVEDKTTDLPLPSASAATSAAADKETAITDQKDPPVPVPETEEEEDPKPTNVDTPKPSSDEEEEKMMPEAEETTTATTTKADLVNLEKKALQELKLLVQDALNNHLFTLNPTKTPPKDQTPAPVADTKPQTGTGEESPVSVVADNDPPIPVSQDPIPVSDPSPPQSETEAPAAAIEAPAKAAAAVDDDDDGAKTVEAIEETIVSTTSPIPLPVKESSSSEAKEEEAEPAPALAPEEVFIYGVKLMEDDRTDVILEKFLLARDYKVKEAFSMLKNTLQWRKEFGIDQLMEEKLVGVEDLEKVVFMNGYSKEGHPVCYNVYGQFQNKDLYQKTFSDEEKRQNFLRWRIQFLEKSIRNLDFSPGGGVCTIVQVNDLKNSPGPGKWELRQATKQALQLLQDNYPEFVAKQVFVNVPWWYLAVNRMISPFLTQRTKSKFEFAGPSKSAETLFKYIGVEQVPVEYGGLSKEEEEGEFGTSDAVTTITLKPSSMHTVEFPATEGGWVLSWEIRVVGWEVRYGAEFVPSGEESYTVIIQKERKIGSGEETVIKNSFKIGEPGKVVLTIDNSSSKKKKLLYRLKTTKTH